MKKKIREMRVKKNLILFCTTNDDTTTLFSLGEEKCSSLYETSMIRPNCMIRDVPVCYTYVRTSLGRKNDEPL